MPDRRRCLTGLIVPLQFFSLSIFQARSQSRKNTPLPPVVQNHTMRGIMPPPPPAVQNHTMRDIMYYVVPPGLHNGLLVCFEKASHRWCLRRPVETTDHYPMRMIIVLHQLHFSLSLSLLSLQPRLHLLHRAIDKRRNHPYLVSQARCGKKPHTLGSNRKTGIREAERERAKYSSAAAGTE